MPPRPGRSRNDSTDDDSNAPEDVLPPFFNTTFSTHRVSPLYVGRQELTTQRLDQLAHRLRDTLVGDVVRGIQIGLESTDTPAGQVGSLRSVKIRWFHAQRLLDRDLFYTEQDGGNGITDKVMRHWNRLPEAHKRGALARDTARKRVVCGTFTTRTSRSRQRPEVRNEWLGHAV